MQITASLVKELRERTGAGMMDCKNALSEANGDIEAAIEAMRKSGVAKAAKKAGRIAAEGIVVIRPEQDAHPAVIVEVNCETDFVAKDENFQGFAGSVADVIQHQLPADLDSLHTLSLAGGPTVEEARLELISKIGENISVRRFDVFSRTGDLAGAYVHGTRIGVLVDVSGGDDTLARDVAMHIAASRPVCVRESDVPRELLDKEREIFTVQALETGKPPEIAEKIVAGKISKFIQEITLLGQPFVKDPDLRMEKVLAGGNATVHSFIRYEVGEGIEKKSEDFAAEVMAQVKS